MSDNKITDNLQSLYSIENISKEKEIIFCEIDQKGKDNLIEYINNELNSNLKLKIEVQNLLKTENTFDNSLGNLYDYLKDKKICSSCNKKINSCNKKQHGYYKKLVYDKRRDEIVTSVEACDVLIKLQKKLHNIYPCYRNYMEIYNTLNELLKVAIQNNNVVMKDTASCIFKVKGMIDKKDITTGFSLFSPSSNKLSEDLLSSLIYLFANADIKSSYLLTKEFFDDVLSFDGSISNQVYNLIPYLQKVPVLAFADFTNIPSYQGEKIIDVLYQILEGRKENNLPVFCSLSSSYKPSAIINYKFKTVSKSKKVSLLLDDMCPILNVKDFDLR